MIAIRKLIARGLVGGRKALLSKGLRCADTVAPLARRCHRGLLGALEVLLSITTHTCMRALYLIGAALIVLVISASA